MGTTRPGPLGKARQITGRERDKIRAELREGYLAGATIRDLVEQTGRSFGFVRTLLGEAGVVLRERGGNQTQRHSGDGLHNTDLFDWLALRRADAGSVSAVGRCFSTTGERHRATSPQPLPAWSKPDCWSLSSSIPAGRAS
ncbi:MAG: helix-turn-helix domain-containing protein [Pseudonocardiaceae bacterium]